MNRRAFLKASVAGVGMTAFGSGIAGAGLEVGNKSAGLNFGKRRPNILFFMIDDMGWRDVGFMGSKYYQTPHIDKLASQGMVFTDAYANAANCAPTRACFLTGQYGPRHGIYTVGGSARGVSADRRIIPTENITVLASDHITMAEVLKTAGYVSASMGKWHMGDPPTHGPCEQGFDVNIAGNATGTPAGGYFVPYNNPQLPDGPAGEYLTDRLSDEAISFIETNKDRPFFLYLTHYAVHTPTQAKQELIDYYNTPEKVADRTTLPDQDNATYAAMIHSVDEGIGRILKRVKDLQLEKNTIVIFFCDNGGTPVTDMYPLRGRKGMFYEGGIREPMIMKWPGKVKPGSSCDVPVIGVDFFPTFMEVAGAKKPDDKILDGESLVPLLAGGGALSRDAIFWHFPAYLEVGDDESRDPTFRTRPVSVIRKGQWKVLQFFEEWVLDGGWTTIDTNKAIELYDLENDLGETTNLAATNTTKRDELLNDLIAWQQSVNAPADFAANPGYGA